MLSFLTEFGRCKEEGGGADFTNVLSPEKTLKFVYDMVGVGGVETREFFYVFVRCILGLM